MRTDLIFSGSFQRDWQSLSVQFMPIRTMSGSDTTMFALCIPQHQSAALEVRTKSLQSPELAEEPTERSLLVERTVKDELQFADSFILIVEDNPELQNYIYDILKEHFRVARANKGLEALSITHSMFPDLILTDIMMSEMDGIELCEKVKNDVMSSHIPVRMLTALDTVNVRIKAMHLGADAYISKPYSDELLLAQNYNIFKSRKVLREQFSSYDDNWKQNYRPEDLDKKFLLRAIEVARANIQNDAFWAEDFADEMNLSRTHLHRKLKA